MVSRRGATRTEVDPHERDRTRGLVACPNCRQWETRYHALVEQALGLARELAAMQRDGFSTTRMQQAEPVKLDDLPAVIREAILEVAEPGSLSYRTEERQAWHELSLSHDPAEIAKAIGQGQVVGL